MRNASLRLFLAVAAIVQSGVTAQSTPSYGSLLGGTTAYGLRDAAGNIYFVLATSNPNLPVTPEAFQKTFVQATCGTLPGPHGTPGPPIPCRHMFVAKIDPTGTRVLFATYLGGSSEDDPAGMAVDIDGNLYVSGITGSTDFPTTRGAYRATPGPGFLTKLTPDGSAVVFSTYLSFYPGGLALDSQANVFLTGSTLFAKISPTPGAF